MPTRAGSEGSAPDSRAFFRREERPRPKPAPGLEPGKVVGDFKLVALIGQGGMGQIWEAQQVSLARTVAVKFVRPERVTEKQLELFAREARAGGRLHHPGIVTVHGYGQSEGLAWIAMELVEGAWTLIFYPPAACPMDKTSQAALATSFATEAWRAASAAVISSLP